MSQQGHRTTARLAALSLAMIAATVPAWAQESNPGAAPQATITSPATNTATNQTSIDVVVDFSGPLNEQGRPRGNVHLLELLVNGVVVATFNVPPNTLSGTHTFTAVDLSAYTNAGSPVILTARASRGNANANLAGTSDPVSIIVDTIAPTVSDINPVNGSFTNDPTPTISANVSDAGGSGLQSAVLKLDGVVVPATLVLSDANTGVVSFTPAVPLAEGSHTIEVQVTDNATNSTTATSSFTVDVTPPDVLITVAPSETTKATKTITIVFTDNLSGVVTSTRTILVDLVERVQDFTFSNGTGTLSQTFGTGTHSIAAQATDQAGNTGEATFTFEVVAEVLDVHRPHLKLLFPTADLSKVAGLTIPVVARASDDLKFDTGIATVELLVDGVVVQTRTATQSVAFFYYIFDLPVGTTPGTKSIQVRATDNVGNERMSLVRLLGVVEAPSSGPVSFAVTAPGSATAGPVITPEGSFEPMATAQIKPLDANGDPIVGFVGVVEFTTTGSSTVTVFFSGTEEFVEVPFTIITSGVHVLRASLVGNPAVSGHATMTVNAAAPFAVTLKLKEFQRLAAGTPLNGLKATVTDQFANPVPGVTVDIDIQFFGSALIGQTDPSGTTDGNGTFTSPPAPIPGNATQMNATASVPGLGSVSPATFASPIVPNIIINVAFEQQTLVAGQPATMIITILDPETGQIKRDFTGTIYIYRFGGSFATGGAIEKSEVLQITFTEADQGVKVVTDGITFVTAGELIVIASTVGPEVLMFGDVPAEFMVFDEFGFPIINPTTGEPFVFQFIKNLKETAGGFSNEIVVLPAAPSKIAEASFFELFPVRASARLVDAFLNGVFNERLSFNFSVSSSGAGFSANIVTRTNLTGFSEALGSTTLPANAAYTASVTISTPDYPGISPKTVSFETFFDPSFALSDMTAVPPVPTVELGEAEQPAADLSCSFVVTTVEPYVTQTFIFSLQGETLPLPADKIITFASATVTTPDIEPSGTTVPAGGTVSISGSSMTITVTNTAAIPIPVTTLPDGSVIPTPVTATLLFDLTGITLSVPHRGEILQRHADSRINVAGFQTRTVAFLEFFGFVGTVVPEGRDALLDSATGQKLAGIVTLDADYASRALVGNPGLTFAPDGTFRVTLRDQSFTLQPEHKIRLQALTPEGGPLVQPDGSPVPGTSLLLDLTADQASAYSTPPVGALDRFYTAPSFAFSRLTQYFIDGQNGNVITMGGGVCPADGTTPGRIEIFAQLPDRTPAPLAAVSLSVSPSEGAAFSFEPSTDANGRALATITATRPGFYEVSGSINVAFNGVTVPVGIGPIRFAFFGDVKLLVVAPGGKVRATLVQTTGTSESPVTDAPSNGTKDARALAVQVRIKPAEESSYRPAEFSVFKGLTPEVRFDFIPNIDAFVLPDFDAEPVEGAPPPPLGFETTFKIAIVVDDGAEGTAIDRPLDPAKRVVDPFDPETREQFERVGNSVIWHVSSTFADERPIRVGPNRLRVVITADDTAEPVGLPNNTGPSITVAHMLAYRERDNGIPASVAEIQPVEPVEPSPDEGTQYVARSRLLLYFNEGLASDVSVSARLRNQGLVPLGYLPDLGLVHARTLQDLTYPQLVERAAAVSASQPSSTFQGASIAILMGDPDVATEQYPDLMRAAQGGGNPSGFDATTGVYGSEARRTQYHHWVMATTAAHRLVDRLKSGSVTIMMADRGFGNGAAVLPDAGNSYFLRGSRVKRPSRIRLSKDFDSLQDKFADGDTRLTPDETAADDLTQPAFEGGLGSHGTKVTIPMVGDGQGPGGKPIHEMVLGTGKDAFVRVFKQTDPLTTAVGGGQRTDNQGIALDAYCKIIQEATKDADAHVYVIERSLNTRRSGTLQQQGTLALHRDKIKTAYEALSKSGKLIIGAAWNEGEDVNGIAENADAGFIAPDNAVMRANLSGADEWKKRVMCVGAMENPFGGGAQPPAGVGGLAPFLKPGTREYRRRISNRGSRISVTAGGRDVATVDMDGNHTVVGGTSSATPLVAGIAAELMLVDPSLKSVDNIHKVLEYIEATAEPIDKSPSDPSVGGAVGDTHSCTI